MSCVMLVRLRLGGVGLCVAAPRGGGGMARRRHRQRHFNISSCDTQNLSSKSSKVVQIFSRHVLAVQLSGIPDHGIPYRIAIRDSDG